MRSRATGQTGDSSATGALIEFGTWRGQNLVLLENLRAIHEPFNKQRTIIGFDTFAGYPEAAGMAASLTGSYSTATGALFGTLIASQFNGTILPLLTGFAVLGFCALLSVFVVEGRVGLFRGE